MVSPTSSRLTRFSSIQSAPSGSSAAPTTSPSVEMPHEELGLFRVVSFWTVRDGKITSGTDYWLEPGSDPAHPDRAQYAEPM